MKIRILTSARKDLADGWDFHDRQAEGVGDYFGRADLDDERDFSARDPEAAFDAVETSLSRP